jgi:hypothetical protein
MILVVADMLSPPTIFSFVPPTLFTWCIFGRPSPAPCCEALFQPAVSDAIALDWLARPFDSSSASAYFLAAGSTAEAQTSNPPRDPLGAVQGSCVVLRCTNRFAWNKHPQRAASERLGSLA